MRKRKDENIIVSQWQSCVEMLNAVNQRRDNMNDRFCAINTAVIAAISFVWDIRTISLIAVGLIICIIWTKLILNFREIKREKYKVIKLLEKNYLQMCFLKNGIIQEIIENIKKGLI